MQQNYDPNKIYGHTDKFTFGKWKDRSLGYVLETDPDYFLYLEKSIQDFKIANGLMKSVYILTGKDNMELQ